MVSIAKFLDNMAWARNVRNLEWHEFLAIRSWKPKWALHIWNSVVGYPGSHSQTNATTRSLNGQIWWVEFWGQKTQLRSIARGNDPKKIWKNIDATKMGLNFFETRNVLEYVGLQPLKYSGWWPLKYRWNLGFLSADHKGEVQTEGWTPVIGRDFYSCVISYVTIEHHPTIRYMVYNGYYKVMSNIPKMGQLPTHVISSPSSPHPPTVVDFLLIRFPRLLWCHNCWMNPEFGNVTHILRWRSWPIIPGRVIAPCWANHTSPYCCLYIS